MKQIDGKWVVSLAFYSKEDADNFRYMLSDGVCISPTGARTKRFTEVEPSGNHISGNVSGTAIQVHTVHGDITDGISGKRVR